ncbi:MAG: hypothetical protein HKN43_10405 [Rhodothermales bacterium]|nr:hypothetical protein [Rhodothermales bacterium]
MPTRRTFLQQSVTTFGTLALLPTQFLQRSLHDHNGRISLGLFFDDSDIERMRRTFTTNAAFRSLGKRLNGIDRDALRAFIQTELRYNDQLFHIIKLSDAAQALSMLYMLTGDEDAAGLAAECVREMLKFDRWDYFLEDGQHVIGIQRASSTMISVAVSADWLGDFISRDERESWLTVMSEKGCDSCFRSIYGMRYPETVIGWTRDEASTYFEHRPWDRPTDLSNRHLILDSTNLKAVPAAALAIGATAYRQHFGDSDKTRRWIEQATYSLSTFRDFFTPDGSYHEGASYANYTALNILKATSVLKRHRLADLTDIINWQGHADYAVGLSMPTDYDPYDVVNFGDNGNAKSGQAGRPKRTAVAIWIASTFRDRKAQWFGLNLGGVQDEWALIWYDDSVPVTPEPQGDQLWHSDLDWIVARTGYDPKDLTVAMRSGGPGNHEHADRNSIIVKSHGEQLVVDPYRPPYGFTDPSWMMRTTAGHSAVLVDGEGHQYHDGTEGTNASQAVAHIVRKVFRHGYCHWTSDATPAYQMVNREIVSITRSVVVLFDLSTVVVFDVVQKESQPGKIQARFFGYNHDGRIKLMAGGSQFQTVRPHAHMNGVAQSPQGVSSMVQSLPIAESESVKHPFVELTTTSDSLRPALLTVLSCAPTDSMPASASVTIEGDTYMVDVANDASSTRIVVVDSGLIPEIKIG